MKQAITTYNNLSTKDKRNTIIEVSYILLPAIVGTVGILVFKEVKALEIALICGISILTFIGLKETLNKPSQLRLFKRDGRSFRG